MHIWIRRDNLGMHTSSGRHSRNVSVDLFNSFLYNKQRIIFNCLNALLTFNRGHSIISTLKFRFEIVSVDFLKKVVYTRCTVDFLYLAVDLV